MNPEYNFTNDPFLEDFEAENVRNFCSWLLKFNSYELPILSYVIALVLTESFTIEEITVIGSIFSTITTNLFLITSHQGFVLQVESDRKDMNDRANYEDRASLAKRIKYIESVLRNNNLI